jgi:hypothetical protein
MKITVLASLGALYLLAGCASTPAHVRTADALPAGCPVEVLREGLPTRPVRSLGEATARCTGDAMGDVAACTRALQDQACALGGDTLWGITSSQTDDAFLMRGHVGHTR